MFAKAVLPGWKKKSPLTCFMVTRWDLIFFPGLQSFAQRQLQQLSTPTCAKINK